MRMVDGWKVEGHTLDRRKDGQTFGWRRDGGGGGGGTGGWMRHEKFPAAAAAGRQDPLAKPWM